MSESLKITYHLYLKSPPIYSQYIEKEINPKLYEKKNINSNDKTKFLRWDMDSITEYNPNFKTKSIYSNTKPIEILNNKNIELNAIAASKIYGNKKYYMVPIYYQNNSYIYSRQMYNTYYENLGFKLIDLGLYHPKKDGFIMQGGSHTGNTGGLMKSILIGNWINSNIYDLE